jgi:hypothetical protein
MEEMVKVQQGGSDGGDFEMGEVGEGEKKDGKEGMVGINASSVPRRVTWRQSALPRFAV